MSRPWRIKYEGAFYHILSRGNNQQDIFFVDADRRSFLKCLGQMSQRFDVDIFAYVLMDNHYHLLLRTNRANLSKCMQWLGTTYTTRFNLRHARNGHLFQGRYKSIIVENDSYLKQLSYYIHRNPLRAGIVKRLIDYHWSSYAAYAYSRSYPDWLDTDLILSQINAADKHRCYKEKVQQYSDEQKSIWEDIRHGLFYGSNTFIDRIKETYLNKEPIPDIPAQTQLKNDGDPDEIIKCAMRAIKCDAKKFTKAGRISAVEKINRDLVIYLLWQTGRFTNTEIGKKFDLTYSSISRRVKIFKNGMDQDAELEKKFKQIKSQIKV
jgi:REP element-mobilizing transposase RayT